MLYELQNPGEAIRRWAGRSVARRVPACWLVQGGPPGFPPVRWFTDNEAAPQAVLRLEGYECMVHGQSVAVASALANLRDLRLQGFSPWPDSAAEADWERCGRRVLNLGRVPPSTRKIAHRLGFRDIDAEQPNYVAHAWYLTGKPRFAERVRHPWRIVEGDELLPLFLRGGVDEREEAYLSFALNAGPSFVCEVEGQAVSWSLTHHGGAVGRIYTPKDQRGRGYASSLTALQADTLLARQGLVAGSVSVKNPASYRIFMGLGAKHIRGPMTWSEMAWPGSL